MVNVMDGCNNGSDVRSGGSDIVVAVLERLMMLDSDSDSDDGTDRYGIIHHDGYHDHDSGSEYVALT